MGVRRRLRAGCTRCTTRSRRFDAGADGWPGGTGSCRAMRRRRSACCPRGHSTAYSLLAEHGRPPWFDNAVVLRTGTPRDYVNGRNRSMRQGGTCVAVPASGGKRLDLSRAMRLAHARAGRDTMRFAVPEVRCSSRRCRGASRVLRRPRRRGSQTRGRVTTAGESSMARAMNRPACPRPRTPCRAAARRRARSARRMRRSRASGSARAARARLCGAPPALRDSSVPPGSPTDALSECARPRLRACQKQASARCRTRQYLAARRVAGTRAYQTIASNSRDRHARSGSRVNMAAN